MKNWVAKKSTYELIPMVEGSLPDLIWWRRSPGRWTRRPGLAWRVAWPDLICLFVGRGLLWFSWPVIEGELADLTWPGAEGGLQQGGDAGHEEGGADNVASGRVVLGHAGQRRHH